jgi:hypothetical protein
MPPMDLSALVSEPVPATKPELKEQKIAQGAARHRSTGDEPLNLGPQPARFDHAKVRQ